MFLNIIGEHRDYLKRPIAFNQITGSFPFNSWNGDINSNIGENITSILDKIVAMLGNFEYFYNLEGKFIF